jgi:dTDP-4-amino-4,6-dideoxygalactose transaminase
MRNYGIEAGYDAHRPGLNAKMSELHAIVGHYNLRRLDALIAERQRKARLYLDLIRDHTNLATPIWPEGVVHTFKDLTVILPPGMAHRRAEIMASLQAMGVETRAYFSPPVHQQRFFSRFADRPLPRTEALAGRVITLPFYTSMTEAEMSYVVDGLRQATRMAA